MIGKIKKTLFAALAFFAIAMPFRELFKVIAVTEIRPVCALPPVFGLMMGIPGVLGCTIGNLAADIVSGYGLPVCMLGFMAQFIYGVFPLFLWNIIRRFDTNEPHLFRLNSFKNVIRYIVIVLINSVVAAALMGAITQNLRVDPLFSTATLMMFYNNFVFCMVLGTPILIFMSIGKSAGREIRLSLNERLVLIFLSLGVVSAGLMGVFAYSQLSRSVLDPLAMWNRIYFYITVDLFIFHLVTLVFLRYSERNIAIPVESIADIAKSHIINGNEKKDSADIVAECERFCGNRNETGILAEAFKTMVLDLDTYIENLTKAAAEKEHIGAELSIATEIQASMLPRIFPPFPNRNEFDIFATMLPAREVGGDFYDFFLIDENKLAVVMADVSGKGVPAALFMVIAKTLIKNNACTGKSPAEVFETVNRMLCENNETGMFVTAFMGYADLRNGNFVYVNAGHDPPLVRKTGGEFEFVNTKPSRILAGFENTAYKEEEIKLDPGDILYLYTDGVTEAMNTNNELFSDQRLLETINRYRDCPLQELLSSIKNEIDLFTAGAEQSDDMTMLALEIVNLRC